MRFHPMLFGLLVPALAYAVPTQARDLTEQERERVQAVFEGLVEEGGPGFAVGIVREGKPVFEAYQGFSDVSHSVPISPKTRINIASVAKQYVALMVLDLSEQGKVDLNADFRTYLTGAMPIVSDTLGMAPVR